MINTAALRDQATLMTERLRLEPQGPEHFDGVWRSLANPESARLTGTQQTYTPEQVRTFLTDCKGRDDRADFAIIRRHDEQYVGEAVLNDLDEPNESMNFRIALAGDFGNGYGTESTKAVIAYGLDVVGLHRITLGVYAFNPRAQRVYQKCGFRAEGRSRDALLWDGKWVDAIDMAILSTDPRPT